jgi:hypothetical protein
MTALASGMTPLARARPPLARGNRQHHEDREEILNSVVRARPVLVRARPAVGQP